MGKGGSKIEITKFFMSQHFGICMGPLEGGYDALLGIIVKEKEAWSGIVAAQTSFVIDKGELFGGKRKEGGVEGVVYWLPGAADQVLPDVLAQKLGRANGLDCPGYRGVASIFFVGDAGTEHSSYDFESKADGKRGFYWSANVPYLPGVWVPVRRAPKGLLVGYSMIPRLGSNFFPIESLSGGIPLGTATFSRDFSTLVLLSGSAGVQIWDVSSMTLRYEYPSGLRGPGVGFTDDGSFYAVEGDLGSLDLVKFTPDGAKTMILENFSPPYAGGCSYVGGMVCLYPLAGDLAYYYNGSAVLAASSAGMIASHFFETEEGEPWVCGAVDGGDGAAFMLMPDGDIEIVATGLTGAVYAMDNFEGGFTFMQAGQLFIAEKVGFTIVEGPVAIFYAAEHYLPWRSIRPGANYIWLGSNEVSTADLSVRRSVDLSDWSAATVENSIYEPLNHAIWTDNGTDLMVRFLDRGDLDANPAHMIYESLTNTDWGMGSPSTAIDGESFEDAAITLFGESLGLSMIWLRQQSIQNFIQEVLDHIQAVLYVDPRTGLLTLKLIRGDYDPETLPVISPSNADLSSFQRKLWGEIVNEVVVTWTNPATEQDETVTVQDLASVATQGGIVSDGRNYYGVRGSELAQRLAQRDLRAAGAPVATCECEVNRTLWEIRPASVISLVWPEYGLDGVAMRITSVDYGRPGDPTIKLTLLEDVYGLDVGSYTAPPSSIWEDTSSPPAPLSPQDAFTLPFYMAVAAGVDVSVAVYPEVLAGVLGTTDNEDTLNYDLWSEVADTLGALEWQELLQNTVIGHAEIVDPLDAEAVSTDVEIADLIGNTVPVVGGFALIGDEGDEVNEIALVLAYSTDDGLELSRGVLDTVPRAWPASTPVWFIDDEALFVDPLTRAGGEVVKYKLLSRTSLGLLPLWSAPTLTETLNDRPWLPNRPADVTAHGVAFSSEDDPIDALARPDPWVTVSWAVRNRLMEDGQVLAWTDGTVTPETDQTTKITVLASDGTTVLATHDGLTGTTFDVPDASFGSASIVILRVSSERTDDDGTFESLQYFDHWVDVAVAGGAGAATGVGTFAGVSEVVSESALSASGAGGFAGEGSAAGGGLDIGGTGTAIVGSFNASITHTLPAYSADDVIFIGIAEDAGNKVWTFPAGWTELASVKLNNIVGKQQVWAKRMDGSEGSTVAISRTGVNGDTAGVIQSVAVSGAIATGAFHEGLVSNFTQSATMTTSSVTTLGTDRLVLNFGAAGTFGGTPNYPDTGDAWTDVWSLNTSAGGGIFGYCSYQLVPAAGAVGAETRTAGGSNRLATASLAVIPA